MCCMFLAVLLLNMDSCATSVIAVTFVLLGISEANQQSWSLRLNGISGARCEHDVSVWFLLGGDHKAQRGHSCSTSESIESYLIGAHATIVIHDP